MSEQQNFPKYIGQDDPVPRAIQIDQFDDVIGLRLIKELVQQRGIRQVGAHITVSGKHAIFNRVSGPREQAEYRIHVVAERDVVIGQERQRRFRILHVADSRHHHFRAGSAGECLCEGSGESAS